MAIGNTESAAGNKGKYKHSTSRNYLHGEIFEVVAKVNARKTRQIVSTYPGPEDHFFFEEILIVFCVMHIFYQTHFLLSGKIRLTGNKSLYYKFIFQT